MHTQPKHFVHPPSLHNNHPAQRSFGGTNTSIKSIQIPSLKNSSTQKLSSDEENAGPPRLSRSFGDFDTGSPRKHPKIYFRGYLMKRSNFSLVDVCDFDDTTNNNGPIPLYDTQEASAASETEDSSSGVSLVPSMPQNLTEEWIATEPLQHSTESSVREAMLAAASFFGMHRHDDLDPYSAINNFSQHSNLSIPEPQQQQQEEEEEVSSAIRIPILNNKDSGTRSASPSCECIDPRDGHVWRSKYCVLEGGVLYFYRNERDADLPEAQEERKRKQVPHTSSDYSKSPSTPPSSRRARDSLSKSPLPRMNPIMPRKPSWSDTRMTPSFEMTLEEEAPIWEKRVALENVGTVRTTEEDYGENSFVLEAADEDSSLGDYLVLRASSPTEMNEWLFKFHSALSSVMKRMINSVCDSQEGGKKMFDNNRVGTMHPTASPIWYAQHHRKLDSQTTTRSISPSNFMPLSHGHGRNGLNRLRTKVLLQTRQSSSSSIDSSPRFASSNRISSSGNLRSFSDVLPFRPKAWDESSDVGGSDNESGSFGGFGYASPSTAPPTDSPFIDPSISQPFPFSPSIPLIPNLQKEEEAPTPGKWIPPHLRRKMEAQSADAAQKYTPPHLRPKQSLESVEKDERQGIFMAERSDYAEVIVDETTICASASYSSHVCGIKIITPIPGQASFDASNNAQVTDLKGKIILGGCADPSFGSILDEANIRGPKVVGTLEAIGGYGGGDRSPSSLPSHLRWEVGAVSECGIRESNEDAFLVTDDLSVACGSTTTFGAKIGLFAIFDGHCGSQASRFAAEQFAFRLNESFTQIAAKDQSHEVESKISVDELREALLEATVAVDDQFCQISKEDGRDWDSGSTALIVVISGSDVLVANLGDCRAVICASGVGQAHIDEFSEDDGWNLLEYDQQFSWSSYVNQKTCFWKEACDIHSPSGHDERRRIEAANGWVTIEREVCVAQLHRLDFADEDVVEIMKRYFSDRIDEVTEEIVGDNNNKVRQSRYRAAPGRMLEISRICGELAVSRALGDRYLKAGFNSRSDVEEEGFWWLGPDFLPYPLGHNSSFRGDLVSAVPEIQAHTVRSVGVDAEFLILACDGLWDVMDPDDAVRITRSLLCEKKWAAKKAVSFYFCMCASLSI